EFNHLNRYCRFGEIHLVVVENINVPRIPALGTVFKSLELVPNGIWREHFTVGLLVKDAGDVTCVIEFDEKVMVFKSIPLSHLGRGPGERSILTFTPNPSPCYG